MGVLPPELPFYGVPIGWCPRIVGHRTLEHRMDRPHATDEMVDRIGKLAMQYRRGVIGLDDFRLEAGWVIDEELGRQA